MVPSARYSLATPWAIHGSRFGHVLSGAWRVDETSRLLSRSVLSHLDASIRAWATAAAGRAKSAWRWP